MVAVPFVGSTRAFAARSGGPVLAYVGTSSPPEGSDRGERGIFLFEANMKTGALSQRAIFPYPNNPSWLAFDPPRTHLYSANEVTSFQGAKSGSVSSYAIDRADGRITLLNTVSSEGAGPAHMSVHPSGKYALVANYDGGTVVVISIRPNGELGPATAIYESRGAPGPARAATAPRGSFAISGHDGSHAHMILADPAGRYVVASDLGRDVLLIWKFDAGKGKLIPNDPPTVVLPPGDGPRHFAFHPDGRWFYSLQEESSTLVIFDFDAEAGRFTQKQSISSLPAGFAGTSFASEVVVSHDGRFVYAANRLHDTIACFAIAGDGTLKFAGEEWTRGDYPGSFTIDPTGNFLYSCNQRSDAITTFRVNNQSGKLTFTGQYTPVGAPSMVLFLG